MARAERTDVVIAGAGPAGLIAACLLQREGVPFVLLERQAQAEFGARPQAGLIEYRTVQALERAGIAGRSSSSVPRITGASSGLRQAPPCSTTRH